VDLLTIVGFAVGVLGVGLTILFAVRAERSQKQLDILTGLRKRLDWPEIQSAAHDLARDISAAGIVPTAIITPGLSGATFANLIEATLAKPAPVYVGIRIWKDGKAIQTPDIDLESSYIEIETSKWRVLMPRLAHPDNEECVLIVDDFVMSGDFLFKLREALIESGVEARAIHSASIVTTQIAQHAHKAPDFSWFISPDDNFYFPWGKAR
jgi:hypoxanthine phosphoribosyltransferase